MTYPILKSLADSGKRWGLFTDAHYDNMPDYEGELYARNTPFMRLYETEGVRNESIIHTGIHGPATNLKPAALLKKTRSNDHD